MVSTIRLNEVGVGWSLRVGGLGRNNHDFAHSILQFLDSQAFIESDFLRDCDELGFGKTESEEQFADEREVRGCAVRAFYETAKR